VDRKTADIDGADAGTSQSDDLLPLFSVVSDHFIGRIALPHTCPARQKYGAPLQSFENAIEITHCSPALSILP